MSKRALKIITAALLLSNAMNGLDSTIISTALPAIISDLHGLQLMGWVVAVFLLGSAVTTPLWSKLGQRIGNKLAFQIATSLFVLGAFLEGISPSMITLIMVRVVMGVGSGGMTAIPYIIYAEIYHDPHQRAKIFSFVTASFSAAAIIGPLVGGWIVDTFSWHWVFYINVPIGLLAIIVIQHWYHVPAPKQTTLPVDYLGATLLSLALVSLLIAIENLNTHLTILNGISFLVPLALLIALNQVERRASDPIVPNRLFLNRHLVCDFILFALIYGYFICFNVYVPMWAQGILGITAIIGGATQIPSSVTNFLGARWGSQMLRHHALQKLVWLGIAAMILSAGMLVLADVHTGYWVLLVSGLFQGAGIGLCFATLQVAVQQRADPQDVPIATSFSLLVRMLGQTFMSSIYSIVLNRQLSLGVQKSGGQISFKALNELTNADSAKNLPASLLKPMRLLLQHGIHQIMWLALILLVLSAVVNAFDGKRLPFKRVVTEK